jgi:signal transduction histidine kinase
MKPAPSHAPFRRKLRFVILTTCVVSLSVACALIFAAQYYFFRKEFLHNVSVIAAVTSKNCAPAVSARQSREADAALASLAASSDVRSAQILLPDGSEFAKFKSTAHDFRTRVGQDRPTFWWRGGDFIQAQPIEVGQQHIGTLFLVTDYGTHVRRLGTLCAGIFCGVLAVTVLVGLVISKRFDRLIADPLSRLAGTIRSIAGSDDYSVRAEKLTDDEIGVFTDSFNQMLGKIQSRDAALRREIAERQRAEDELQTVHGQLLDTSRQAGMAEVATGVLHNVGNVLNSVNVSALLISEKLDAARLHNLVRTTRLLEAKAENLGSFLTTDPKGRLVPTYLAELSQHLLRQREEALLELELLTKNIEHIKHIVSMQQNYARTADFAEPMSPDSLVEDALGMTAANLGRHQIKVVRDCATTALVAAERHKVLQILVNLIRNAQHALDEGAPPEKRLVIRVHESGPGTVAITVTDNGVGILPENLTRIFSHGFTTRKDGHGFGLHSAALAAQQMGGRLIAASDGPSRGASFSLELPLAQLEVAA